MNKSYLVGIDIGTSSVKVVLTDTHGVKLYSHCRPHEILQPRPGYVEQDAQNAWWVGAKEGIQACIQGSGVNAAHIAGICASGMVPSFCPLDQQGMPVRPAILYRDNRAIAQAERLTRELGFAFSLQDIMPKLLWLKEQEPESYERIRMVLNPHSYIAYKLTGQYSVDTDIATIFGGIFDEHTGAWMTQRVRDMGLDPKLLPPIFRPTDVVGRVTREAAVQTGLQEGTPVVAGTGDSYTVLVGTGTVEAGEGVIYLGTAATFLGLRRSLDQLRDCAPFATGDAVFLANVLTGGEITRWFGKSVLTNSTTGYDELEAQACAVPAGADHLYMLPHLLGERTPRRDPLAVGTLFGLTSGHTTGHIYRALLEGVAYALRESYEAAYMPLTRVVVGGGGGNSPLWRQMLADVLRLELEYMPAADNALGTAYVAGLSIGVFDGFGTMKREWLSEKQIVSPDPVAADAYNKHFAFYKELNGIMQPAYQLRSELFTKGAQA